VVLHGASVSLGMQGGQSHFRSGENRDGPQVIPQSAITRAGETTHPSAHLLWYARPAEKWTEALPVGNGRLGAMVFGRIEDETLALNEDTLYAGEPQTPGAVSIRPYVDDVFRLVQSGHYEEADRRVREKMTGRVHQSYAALGTLRLRMEHEGEAVEYRRELDLDGAVARVGYRIGPARYSREIFASAVDQVLVVRLECDRPGTISFTATLETPHHFARQTADGDRTIALCAKLPLFASVRDVKKICAQGDQRKYPELFGPDGQLRRDVVRHSDAVFYASEESGPGMTFQTRLTAVADGGHVAADPQGLHVRDADAVTLLLAAASSFAGYRRSPSREGLNPAESCRRRLVAASAKPYAKLRDDHQADFRRLFDRVALDLGPSPGGDLPTDQRIRRVARQFDPQLAALHFQYGRYLLISSSRPGDQPANLQGLWADALVCPWNGGYHLDVNLAMNYWPAQTTGLQDCAEPLVDYIERLAAMGRITAERTYGNRGWVAHIATSIWCNSDPLDMTPMSAWNMGGGWLCQNLWDHYAFGLDRDFLARRAYPLLKGASEFYLDWLREDAVGRLVTPVSLSPENRFLCNGQKAAVSMASTMDMAILRDLFAHTLHAAEVLDADPDLRQQLRAALPRLLPYNIGRHGQLQEWYRDWDRPGDHHRHVSHLWAVYPAAQIDAAETPLLGAAAARSLALRCGLDPDRPDVPPDGFRGEGDRGEVGFDRAWRIHLWGRLGYSDLAGNTVREILADGVNPNLMNQCYAGKPLPFQIDGNLGFTSGVADLLLHSRLQWVDNREIGEMDLLPALPKTWSQGSVRGLRARGGFVVDLSWTDGRLAEATIRSTAGAACRVRGRAALAIVSRGRPIRTDDVGRGMVEFATEAGQTYWVKPVDGAALMSDRR